MPREPPVTRIVLDMALDSLPEAASSSIWQDWRSRKAFATAGEGLRSPATLTRLLSAGEAAPQICRGGLSPMKIAILGGGGAMGGLFGGYLARSGEDVVLVDVSQASVDAINRNGLAIEEKDGSTATLRVKASSEPSDIGPVD